LVDVNLSWGGGWLGSVWWALFFADVCLTGSDQTSVFDVGFLFASLGSLRSRWVDLS
jgi:hypothetical protein